MFQQWLVVYVILLTIIHISSCTYDFVEIRDGGSDNAPLLARYCDEQASGDTLKSSSNSMYLKMRSDNSGGGSGFRIHYKIGRTLNINISLW